MLKDNIEYLGLNVSNGQLLNKKTYYHWNSEDVSLPLYLKDFLYFFDYGKRDNGYSHSISAFIKNCNIEKITKLIDYGNNCCNIVIDKQAFLDSFLSIADLSNDTHYDPIVSFKFNGTKVTGMSFYVTALKDKSLMTIYLDTVKSTLSLYKLPQICDLITSSVLSRCSDMFQVAWDFDSKIKIQNKIYLKVKDIQTFLDKIKTEFDYITDYVYIDGFRFCELAFVINNGEFKMLNLYFKPL